MRTNHIQVINEYNYSVSSNESLNDSNNQLEKICDTCNDVMYSLSQNERPVIFKTIESLLPIENLLINKLNSSELADCITIKSITHEMNEETGAAISVNLHSEPVDAVIKVDSSGYDLDFVRINEDEANNTEKCNKVHLFLIDFFESLSNLVDSTYFNCKY